MDKLDQTLLYYQHNAGKFIKGTIDVDMHDAQMRFLKNLPEKAYILDFGCGSGRDAKLFLQQGYRVDAVDGSEELCKRASEFIGAPVKQMLFNELCTINTYDGVWACSSILHLGKVELQDVLRRIAAALKVKGVLYTSFKYGTFEGMRNGRYFTDFTEKTLAEFMKDVPSLTMFEKWVTHDVRPGREEEQWINILARRI